MANKWMDVQEQHWMELSLLDQQSSLLFLEKLVQAYAHSILKFKEEDHENMSLYAIEFEEQMLQEPSTRHLENVVHKVAVSILSFQEENQVQFQQVYVILEETKNQVGYSETLIQELMVPKKVKISKRYWDLENEDCCTRILVGYVS